MMFYSLFQLHPILIAAAIIPAIVLMIYIYRKDRLEQEPKGLLILLIVFGILSTSLASFAERIGLRILSKLADPTGEAFALLSNFLIIGLAEEGSKYLFLKWRTWRNPNFNCQFDGLVYAVFVSLGFALWENLYYVVMYGLGGAVIRAVTAIPGHACFGVFMGVFYGQAKALANQGNEESSRKCRILALICPMLLHGLYDYIATRESGELTFLFLIFIAAMFAAAFLMVRKLSREDHYI